ncbi:hypothetical protein [Burkholderia sp. F1]|uniref:hypothetical protein n=1 Tax=Burkholderia sp. F1 TaxID=3366817 RepID=UPI003D73BE65
MSTRNCEENAKKYRESPDETGLSARGRMRAGRAATRMRRIGVAAPGRMRAPEKYFGELEN